MICPRQFSCVFRVSRLAIFVIVICLYRVDIHRGQEVFPTADPRDFGLVVPQAPQRPGNDRRVVIRTEDGNTVVGKVYLEIGDHFLVLCPDGRIVSVLQSQVSLSDRPFQPWSSKQIIQSLTQDVFSGFNARSTRHYVYIYNSSSEYYHATSRVLETMYPKLVAYCQRQKLNVQEPEVPLIVIMFATEEQFNQYRPMPAGIAAYYNPVNNIIIMYEKSNWADVAPAIAVKQSISTIAHEGVHQILANIGVHLRLANWPMWICEGLPEYFAPTEVGRRVRWAGIGKINQLRLHALVEQFKDDRINGDGNWLRAIVAATKLDNDGYAAAWALTHYLAKARRKQFFAFLGEVSRQQPLEPLVDGKVLFEKYFGDNYSGLEEDFLSHLENLPYVDPIANQPHFVAVMVFDSPSKRRLLFLTSSAPSIHQWQKETLQQLSPQQRAKARLKVQAYPNRYTAEQAYQSLAGK